MNSKFYELPEEKQMAVFNAAMEVFGEYEYKRASTDLIARKAGISKGLLFYYFNNKKELYLQTYDYVSGILTAFVADDHLMEITDFFEMISYATEKKVMMLEKNPYIMNFSMRSFYSQKEETTAEIQERILSYVSEKMVTYFNNIDQTKFRDGIDLNQLMNMLVWMTDGYLHMKQMNGSSPGMSEIKKEFDNWTKMFKKIAYKEEFQ